MHCLEKLECSGNDIDVMVGHCVQRRAGGVLPEP